MHSRCGGVTHYSTAADAIDYKTFACLPATIAPYVWKYLRYFIHGYLLR
jgi:hypothetical protein